MGGLGEDAFSPLLQSSPSVISSLTALVSTKENPFTETPADPFAAASILSIASVLEHNKHSNKTTVDYYISKGRKSRFATDDSRSDISVVVHESINLLTAKEEKGGNSWYIREGSRFTEAIRAGGRRKR
jgi:hypothetical protein